MTNVTCFVRAVPVIGFDATRVVVKVSDGNLRTTPSSVKTFLQTGDSDGDVINDRVKDILCLR